jgi:hypothetical protein
LIALAVSFSLAQRHVVATVSRWRLKPTSCSPRPGRRHPHPDDLAAGDIELDATGLPRLDRGRFYQAWLRNADGVLVPIGTFNEGQKVTLWAGVSPKDFPPSPSPQEAG